MIAIIVQARMSSTRLPGKVLADISGAPSLQRQLERLYRCTQAQAVVVATSDDPSDDPIARLCAEQSVPLHRGSLHDVLARFAGAAEAFGTTLAVRVTADCPLIDPQILDQTVHLHLRDGNQYTANALERRYPKGLDVEVIDVDALRLANKQAVEPYDREHVTSYFYRHPERFRIGQLRNPLDLGDLRWTVDYPQDLEFVRQVFAALYPSQPAFGMADVLELLRRQPQLSQINQHLV